MALYITFAAVADCVATIVFCWRLSSNGTGVKRYDISMSEVELMKH